MWLTPVVSDIQTSLALSMENTNGATATILLSVAAKLHAVHPL